MVESKFNILLVNDSSEDEHIIKCALSACEKSLATLEIAETLSDVLARILKGGLNLILLDLSSSKARGHEILGTLRARLNTVPVIVFVGNADENAGIRAMNEGARAYLYKNDITRDSLRNSINFVLGCYKNTEDQTMDHNKLPEKPECPNEEDKIRSFIKQSRTTVHDISQPLTALMGTIYLMKMDQTDPGKMSVHLKKMESFGKKISEIIKEFQTICHDTSRLYSEPPAIMHPEQKSNIHNFKEANDNLRNINSLFDSGLNSGQPRYNGSAG
jgi:two-component system, cell cycle response regulator